jgi:hypothetical protein
MPASYHHVKPSGLYRAGFEIAEVRGARNKIELKLPALAIRFPRHIN